MTEELTSGPASVTFNEDCMTVMSRYPDKYFDLAVVDPPYGLGDEKLTQGGTWASKYKKGDASWDKAPTQEYWNELFRVSKNWIVWGGNYFIEHLPNCRNFIAWHKPYMDGMHTMSNVELAFTSFDKNAKKVSFNKDKENNARIHICQKPVKLYEWIYTNYAKPTDKILDTHLGSGSSRIAAYNAELDFTGCELDPEYFQAAEKRFRDHKSQLRIKLK